MQLRLGITQGNLPVQLSSWIQTKEDDLSSLAQRATGVVDLAITGTESDLTLRGREVAGLPRLGALLGPSWGYLGAVLACSLAL